MKPLILIVDDTPINVQVMAEVLRADYRVKVATSGAIALTLAGNPELRPDLILLDVMMPEMDGYEVCRRLQQSPETHDIPVIFVTARADEIDEEFGLSLGASDYIAKPIKAGIVLQRVRNLLERERLHQEVETHRHHLEDLVVARTADLSVAKEAAEAASRAKTIFLANMSHELHTPLHGIMGMTQLALRRATDPKQVEQLTVATQSAKRLLGIIDDILDITKLEAERLTLESSVFSLGPVLENLVSLLAESVAAKGLTLLIDLPPAVALLALRGDPLRLGQILLNLAGNAVKFTAHGTVTVRVRLAEDGPSEVLLRIEVQDTGIGIAAADQPRLFSAFEQADGSMTRKHGGAGLGLFISRRLARLMGGDVGVDSQPGSGSTFWLSVRLGKAPAGDGAVQSETI